ncbi:MAG: ATP-binding cassette domain-containing protein [Erysipelotrichaceae bacterium]|jgi:D-methionine transport system ATP-binding protein|nr:ATP-binding cassette domain-containing protein [Erysipelotrichaceae bacterium]MBR3265778.1 ATP-binding cassette domain-containing protein [Erysipelotrichaceae bacterium]MCR5095986.1 ATP-binding cassette domain-containing protein [Erysipelotrichaceae bacterium]
MAKLIKVSNLSKTFESKAGVVEALNDVSFEIDKGEIFGIIGLSGAGKSTLVRCLNLLEKPSSGEIIIDGENMMDLDGRKLRLKRRKIGMIFQSFNLLMQDSILANVCFPMEIAGVSRSEAKKRALEYLKIVGLEEKAKAYPSQLSGGQKQRVAIARVLASEPEILLCDEATSALDPETTKSILNLIKDINRKYNITVVVITHEMAVIQEICNRCIVLENGRLAEENTVEELFRHPKTNAARRLIFNSTNQVRSMNSGKIIRIAFEEANTTEPVIANLILEFKKPVNILESNISSINGTSRGQMMVQLPDDDKLAEKMIAYLKKNESINVAEVSDYE